MALLWYNDVTHTGYYFDPVLMILAGILPAILAVLIGLPLLSRLRGDYFSFGTLGFGIIVTTLFINGGKFTGGAEGRLLVKKMPEDVVFNLRTSLLGSFAGGCSGDFGGLLLDFFQGRACPEGHPGRRGLGGVARHQRTQVQDHRLCRGCGHGRGGRQHLRLLSHAGDPDQRPHLQLAVPPYPDDRARGNGNAPWSVAGGDRDLPHNLVRRLVPRGLGRGDLGGRDHTGDALHTVRYHGACPEGARSGGGRARSAHSGTVSTSPAGSSSGCVPLERGAWPTVDAMSSAGSAPILCAPFGGRRSARGDR